MRTKITLALSIVAMLLVFAIGGCKKGEEPQPRHQNNYTGYNYTEYGHHQHIMRHIGYSTTAPGCPAVYECDICRFRNPNHPATTVSNCDGSICCW